MEWNTYYYNFNARRIETFNIFKHDTFFKYINKHFKDIKDRNEFANAIKRELQYFFWSKSEWELVIKLTDDNRVFLYPWCGSKNPENEKIEVTDETNFDWLSFARYHIDKQIYKNEAKIDIYDQVMFVWDRFVDYVWGQNKHFIISGGVK